MDKCLIIALVVLLCRARSQEESNFDNNADLKMKDSKGFSDSQQDGSTVLNVLRDKLVHVMSTMNNKVKRFRERKHRRLDPEVHMNVSQLIRYQGYPVEEYTVPTEDGFLLGLQRIPHGRHDNYKKPRPVVFLQHGLLCSSTNWVTNLANESLAFLLADEGYDVWLGNIRGNVYSRKHKTLDPGMAKFWAWSWDEHAALDLPALINFALNTSKAKHLYYIGHSQGTLIAFAQLSKSADMRNKIKMFFAMGPVITAKNIYGLVYFLAYITPQLSDFFSIFGLHEFLPNDAIMKLLAETLCDAATQPLCSNLIFLIAGFDTHNFNTSRLPVYISHTPAGTSVQNMAHFSQMVRVGNFQKYDYGSPALNKKHYGQIHPPLYDAGKVAVPTVLFSGGKDWLADPKDVQILAAQLPNLVHHHIIPNWNHLDFVWGVDARSLVYNQIISYMKKDLTSP